MSRTRTHFGLWVARNVLRVAQQIDDLVRGVCRCPSVVDHVFDGADTAQGYGNEIVELDRRNIGYLEGVGVDDARIDVEEAVGPQPPPLVGPDVVSHLVGGCQRRFNSPVNSLV